ncbi:MAG: tRNA lysidine(34) synthetase TilS [Oligoflexia bacterium]|nr:tRNA lysidine(34) synthetase TilS [Oligoflexia bacterium]
MKVLRKRVLTHVIDFLNKAQLEDLFGSKKSLLVSVSGGRDSMFCLWLMNEIAKEIGETRIDILHFNHGTRATKEHENDLNLIKKFCKKNNLNLIIKERNAKDWTGQSNFESQARTWRYEHYRMLSSQYHAIILGHHIDDSLEWSLLSQLKGGAIDNTLGIPMKRGKFVRPLMCFTRRQITYLVKAFRIPFNEDITNGNDRFERNYLRKEILPKLEKRYGNIQRNYVLQKNLLCSKLGLSIFEKRISQDHSLYNHYIKRAPFNSLMISEQALNHLKDEQLKELINKVLIQSHSSGRSKSRKELDKLLKAWRAGKQGPWSLSENINVYSLKRNLWFLSKNINLENYSASQIPCGFNSESYLPNNGWQKTEITFKISKKKGMKRHPFLQPILDDFLRQNLCVEPIVTHL